MIEVGEYVRIDNGMIIKYEFLEESENEVFFGQEGKGYVFEDMEEFEDFIRKRIIKHSKNIIDLIEEGDYVNGQKIKRINDYGDFKRADFNLDYDDCDAVYENDIKSIVTHEQFEQIKYKVKE